jgi:hypothetical protein
MNNQPKNTEDDQFDDVYGQNNGSRRDNQQNDNSGYEDAPESGEGIHDTEENDEDAVDNGSYGDDEQNDNSGYEDAPESGEGIRDTDKYLAIEQPGVSYTHDTNPTINSDHSDFGSESLKQEWNEEGGNSRNSDAFNQDDYILDDNVDLDEDQNQSISSDDEDFEESNERYTN